MGLKKGKKCVQGRLKRGRGRTKKPVRGNQGKPRGGEEVAEFWDVGKCLDEHLTNRGSSKEEWDRLQHHKNGMVGEPKRRVGKTQV